MPPPPRPISHLAVVVVGALLAVVAGPLPTVPASTTATAVMVGAGDIGTCTGDGDAATAALLDKIGGTVFTLGDNAYVDGTVKEFGRCYGRTWGRHKGRTAIAVAGNHDYNTPGASAYFRYFGAAAGDPAKGYYHRTLGAWHVVVLNSNCEEVGGCHAGSVQERWLRKVLDQSGARCTVALWHHPG